MKTSTKFPVRPMPVGSNAAGPCKIDNDQQARPMWLKHWLFLLFAMVSFGAHAQFAVTTNGGSGLAGSYGSLAAAITALNAATITSPVVITCAAGAETAPIAGYNITATGTVSNTITIQGAGAGSSTITAFTPQASGVKTDAIIKIVGGDYITIQGFTLQENASNSTTAVLTNNMTEIGIGLWLAAATNGAQNNTIQNNAISLGATYQNAIGILTSSSSSSTNTALAATSTAGTNSNNKFYSNTITNVAYGMYLICEPITATINESGIDIGGSSALTGNSITFGKAVLADIGLTRFSGVNPAGIGFRNGVGNSVRFNTITSNNLLYAQSGGVVGVVMVGGGTTPAAAVVYTSTISDNILTINNTNNTNITGIDFGAGTSNGTMVANNNNITINQTSTLSNLSAVMGIKASYVSATNTANNNSIIINQNTTANTNSTDVTAINCAGVGATVNVNNNPVISIRQSVSGTGTYGGGTITYIGVSAASGTVNVTGNTITTAPANSIRNTGTLTCIEMSASTTVLNNFKSNIVNIDRVATSGAVNFTASTATPSEVADSISLNNISFTGLAGSSTVAVISSLGGSATTQKSISNNTISVTGTNTGLTKAIVFGRTTGAGKINGNAITISNAAVDIIGIDGSGTGAAASQLSGNSISIASTATTGGPTMVGINCAGTGPYQVTNNTISQMNFSGIVTTAPIVSGISISIGTGNNINNNTISNISIGAAGSSSSATVNGILVSGSTSLNVFKNKLYNIGTLLNGSATLVSGISITGGAANQVYNNLIGNLTAGAASATDAVRGISITSGTASTLHNVYYNTIYLNASSSGANFGTTGVFHTASSTATTSRLTMRNNIIVNTSTPSGTGSTVVFRRSSGALNTINNYINTSNNNLFYAGTPGATRLIYSDGTATFTTLALYKAGTPLAGTIAPRDQASVSEMPTFASTTGTDPNYLHLSTTAASLADGGGAFISGFTDDYDGDTRNATTPDIGADEFCVVPSNLNYSTNTIVSCPNVAIAASNPTFTGSSATSYSVSPALPAGLSLNTSTGVISGTPTAATPAANYTVTVNNACGSTTHDVNITINPDATITLTSGAGTDAQVKCNGAAITTITYAIGGGGTGAGAVGLPTGLNASYSAGVFTISGTPTQIGTFNYTVTTTGTCAQVFANGSIQVTAAFTATYNSHNASACNGNDGFITVTPQGGLAPYTYNWSGTLTGGGSYTAGNTASVTGLGYGFYNVTVTDAAGCAAVALTNIHIENAYYVFVTNNGSISAACSNTGSILLYGNAGIKPYTYSIDGVNYFASNTFNGLAPGSYTAYVKDSAGCISTKAVSVGVAAPVVVTAYARGASSCSPDGSIELYRTGGIGPYTYSLDNITYQSSNVFLNKAAGTYTGYVKDSYGCLGSLAGITISQGNGLTVTAGKTNTSVCVNDGTIQLRASGGVAPYSYSLDNITFQAGATFFNVGSGAYTGYVKDSKGCAGTVNVSVGTNPIVVTSYAAAASSCASSNGSIQLFRTGGVGPYTYSLDGNTYQSSNVFTGLTPGVYDGYVKDSKTCVGIQVNITVGPTCPGPITTKSAVSAPSKVIANGVKIQAFPNPSASAFSLKLEGYSNEKVVITVTDVLGRKVFTTSGPGTKMYQFGREFKSGVYTVQVVQTGQQQNIKLVKE